MRVHYIVRHRKGNEDMGFVCDNVEVFFSSFIFLIKRVMKGLLTGRICICGIYVLSMENSFLPDSGVDIVGREAIPVDLNGFLFCEGMGVFGCTWVAIT